MRLPTFLTLLPLALALPACSPTWAATAQTAADIAQDIACAVCNTPPPPAVESKRAPTVEDVLALLAWAAEIQRRAAELQREAAGHLRHVQPAAPAEVQP